MSISSGSETVLHLRPYIYLSPDYTTVGEGPQICCHSYERMMDWSDLGLRQYEVVPNAHAHMLLLL
jgi:hypothetical protein